MEDNWVRKISWSSHKINTWRKLSVNLSVIYSRKLLQKREYFIFRILRGVSFLYFWDLSLISGVIPRQKVNALEIHFHLITLKLIFLRRTKECGFFTSKTGYHKFFCTHSVIWKFNLQILKYFSKYNLEQVWPIVQMLPTYYFVPKLSLKTGPMAYGPKNMVISLFVVTLC